MAYLFNKKIDVATGVVIRESYSLNGRLHRDPADGPALIIRDPDFGSVAWEIYKKKGRFHRENGPAEISRNAEGNPVEETYYKNGEVHREPEEGPAIIEHIYENNYYGGREIAITETYVVNGTGYRDPTDGPYYAARYLLTGEIYASEYSPVDPTRPVSEHGSTSRVKQSGRHQR